MDPIITPLVLTVLGKLASDVIADACKDYLKGDVLSVLGWLEKLGEGDKVALAYQDAMERAYAVCLDMLLQNLKALGLNDDELKEYAASLKKFIKDKRVSAELLSAIREPERADLPSANLLRERWEAIGGLELPSDMVWQGVARAFRRQATKNALLSPELREMLNAQNIQQVKELLERQGGVSTPVQIDHYRQRMRLKYAPVDLANVMPATADDPGRMVIRDVFIAQHVRENPPPVELPKDVLALFGKEGTGSDSAEKEYELDTRQIEQLRAAYGRQSPRPVLDVIGAPANRLLVITGDPGAGKSTLLRYLLTGIIEPPLDSQSGQPLVWTQAFKDAFPLLIELRDFYGQRQKNECDSFLEYVGYMGKTEQWFLDARAAESFLNDGPALVMFDGLDEIFDPADRERTMHEIAGFAMRYPRARIVVTSRPVGYKPHILREAGFAHYGLQDLDDQQIKTFIRGWFALTFPQDQARAKQRSERVLGSVERSASLRLLAGNPMLLTIMALLAREAELPRERVSFYEKAVESLCHHWDVNRHLDLPDDTYLKADDKKKLLRRVAMRMQNGAGGLKGNFIQEHELEQEIQAFLVDDLGQNDRVVAKQAARRVIQQLRERNYILCLRGPHLYGFVHRTFLEYLTATEYVLRFDRQPQQMTIEDLLALFEQHCRDDEWREVLRLICGQINEQYVETIIERVIALDNRAISDGERESTTSLLPMAILCLSETRNKNKLTRIGEVLLNQSLLTYRNENTEAIRALLDAAKELGTQWPSGQQVARIALIVGDELPWQGQLFWPQFVAALFPDKSLILKFFISEFYALRWDATEALGNHWPDDETYNLLLTCAVDDHNANVRESALLMLTEKWPSDVIRQLLSERAIADAESYLRSSAFEMLAKDWNDEQTRQLLAERAIVDAADYVRTTTLGILAEKWPEEQTRQILIDRAVDDADANVRSTALEKLAEKWKDEQTRRLLAERAIVDAADYVRTTTLGILAEKWPEEQTRQLLIDRAVDDADANVRSTALEKLAEKWKDEQTRQFLITCAMQALEGYSRSQALKVLARGWPDEQTRQFLADRVVEDTDVRSSVLQTLTEYWKDDTTRRLLTDSAVNDTSAYVRSIALLALAKYWKDDTTHQLLIDYDAQDDATGMRSTALQALSEGWQDEETRQLLIDRAVDDADANVRSTALEALAENWKDEQTRQFLAERAIEDMDGRPRSSALRSLAEKWKDEQTRKLLAEFAIEDADAEVRSTTLRALAEGWQDGQTRQLLADRAIHDANSVVRGTVIQNLDIGWEDEQKRQLLAERAVEDADAGVRSIALEQLAEGWKEEETRHLLTERAIGDADASVRSTALEHLATGWKDEQTQTLISQEVSVNGYAATQVGAKHSEFGRIVFTRDLDGVAPYLDPTEPVAQEHIEEAARATDIPEHDVEAVVQALSAHMGWDITQGSAANVREVPPEP